MRASDIFSFGTVLYEMITGRHAFHGDSYISTLAAVLLEDPRPAVEAASGAAAELNRVIVRCLRKNPAHRFQHMDEVKACLEDIKKETESGLAIAVRSPQRRSWKLLLAAAAVLAVLAATTAWRLARNVA
jgi:serine/threonine protein kinase